MDKEAKAKRPSSRFAELVGEAGAGALVGSLFGGLPGAVAGGLTPALAAPMKKVFGEMLMRRFLSDREAVRVGTGAYHARNTIAQHLAAGHEPRDDGFFGEDESGRSSAKELFEGTLLKCKNEHEEKKTAFIGNIYGNAAFSTLSVAALNAILILAKDLSYRQICIVAALKNLPSEAKLNGGTLDLNEVDEATEATLVLEMKDLGSKGIVPLHQPAPKWRLMLELTSFGEILCATMGLRGSHSSLDGTDRADLYQAEEMLLSLHWHKAQRLKEGKNKSQHVEPFEPYYRHLLVARERVFGESDPKVAEVLESLAGICRITDRHTEAATMYQQSINILENQLGPNYPGLESVLWGLSGVELDLGREEEAERLSAWASKIQAKVRKERREQAVESKGS